MIGEQPIQDILNQRLERFNLLFVELVLAKEDEETPGPSHLYPHSSVQLELHHEVATMFKTRSLHLQHKPVIRRLCGILVERPQETCDLFGDRHDRTVKFEHSDHVAHSSIEE